MTMTKRMLYCKVLKLSLGSIQSHLHNRFDERLYVRLRPATWQGIFRLHWFLDPWSHQL